MRLKRTVKMALTCGEETEGTFNGAGYLATHERALVDAEFALNEGGGGQLDASGHPVLISVEAAEKTPQDYDLVVTNPWRAQLAAGQAQRHLPAVRRVAEDRRLPSSR